MIKNLLLQMKLSTLATLSTISITQTPQSLTDANIQEINIKNAQTKHTISKTDILLGNNQKKKEVITLLKKGYSHEQIQTIYNNLNQTEINILLTKGYINITEYLKYPYFNFSKLDRYLSYQRTNHAKIKDTIIRVNIGLDYEFYTNIQTIENPDSISVLVNKYNQLPSDYIPSDLTQLKCDSNYKLRQEAAFAFDTLVEAAKKENVNIYPYSAYRSYDYQNTIYNRYVNRDGQELADTYSARPGHSEHQTGLTVDIKSVGHNEITNEDYKWMKENAAKYGFIIRYPENTTEITGYQEEPWQLRYVGTKIATEISNLNITFDEYYQIKIAKNNQNQTLTIEPIQSSITLSNQDIPNESVPNISIQKESNNLPLELETEKNSYNISFDTTFTLNENSKIYKTAADIGQEDKSLKPRNALTNERVITGIIIEENGIRKMYTNNEKGNMKLEEAIENNLPIIGILSNGNEGFFRIEDIVPIEKQLTLK